MMTTECDRPSKTAARIAAIIVSLPVLVSARDLMNRFHRLLHDRTAVKAALTEPWSNGQTEGQNTKLKLVKHQMYGRAKLDLLRARLLGAP